jgi:hypothetical protein
MAECIRTGANLRFSDRAALRMTGRSALVPYWVREILNAG